MEKHIAIIKVIIEERNDWEKEVKHYFDKEQIPAEYQYAIIEKAQGNNATLEDLVELYFKDKFLEMFLEFDPEDEPDCDIVIEEITIIESIVLKLEFKGIKVTHTGGAKANLIKKLKDILDIEELPNDYQEFLLKYGVMSFGGTDINGILNNVDDIIEPCHYNVIGLSKEANELYKLPNRVLILGDAGLGDQYALICDKELSSFGKIFYWNPSITSLEHLKIEYDSFSEFLNERALRELS